MIVRTQHDYFRGVRQRAFEALRQGHAGKAAAYNHDPIAKLRHEGFQRGHDPVVAQKVLVMGCKTNQLIVIFCGLRRRPMDAGTQVARQCPPTSQQWPARLEGRPAPVMDDRWWFATPDGRTLYAPSFLQRAKKCSPGRLPVSSEPETHLDFRGSATQPQCGDQARRASGRLPVLTTSRIGARSRLSCSSAIVMMRPPSIGKQTAFPLCPDMRSSSAQAAVRSGAVRQPVRASGWDQASLRKPTDQGGHAPKG
jgi:hypothetical protein